MSQKTGNFTKENITFLSLATHSLLAQALSRGILLGKYLHQYINPIFVKQMLEEYPL